MKEIAFSMLKMMKASELRQAKSFHVMADGRYLCSVVIPSTDYMRDQVVALMEVSNSIGEAVEIDEAMRQTVSA